MCACRVCCLGSASAKQTERLRLLMIKRDRAACLSCPNPSRAGRSPSAMLPALATTCRAQPLPCTALLASSSLGWRAVCPSQLQRSRQSVGCGAEQRTPKGRCLRLPWRVCCTYSLPAQAADNGLRLPAVSRCLGGGAPCCRASWCRAQHASLSTAAPAACCPRWAAALLAVRHGGGLCGVLAVWLGGGEGARF